MARAGFVLFLIALLAAPAFSGCLGGPAADAGLPRADWQVGDRWVYLRSTETTQSVYVREVTNLYQKGDYQVFEVKEGIQGHPVQHYSLYTVGRLQFMGMDVRDGAELRTRLDPLGPLPFHYIFPLEPGHKVAETGRIRQTSGDMEQLDTVEVEAEVFPLERLTLGDRIYSVYPYEIRIRYTTTPFDTVAVFRGNWSPGVGQSVLTTLDEQGTTLTYELLSFTHARPQEGPPVYDLADGLQSRTITRGFDASIDGPGYTRHLFHVERPTTVGVRFSTPAAQARDAEDRIDLVVIRPLGYARAGIADNVSALTEPGVVLHLAAAKAGDPVIVLQSPNHAGLQQVALAPGQVYELLVASNTGPVQAEVKLGTETQHLDPVETGRAQVLALKHRRVQETLQPGPHRVRDDLEAIVAVSEDSRIEGVVYALDHGARDLVDLDSARKVTYQVGPHAFEDPHALYGYYLGFRTREPFTAAAGFEYTAEMTLRAEVDYELGAMLLRLLPPQ